MTALAIRIGQLLRLLLGTDKAGEIVATVAALKRTLTAAGVDHHKLAETVERGLALPSVPDLDADWRALAKWCSAHDDLLSDKESAFIDNLCTYRKRPSEAQVQWLRDIAARLREGAPR